MREEIRGRNGTGLLTEELLQKATNSNDYTAMEGGSMKMAGIISVIWVQFLDSFM